MSTAAPQVHDVTRGRAGRVAAVVLAAGQGTRMGRLEKMLVAVQGRPMVVHAVEAALASRAAPVVVVTGHAADGVRKAVAGLPVCIVHNPAFAQGLASSLRAGIAAVPLDSSGAIVLLGDMPGVTAVHVDRLVDAFEREDDRPIVVPTAGGRRGNPVLWPRRLFDDLRDLSGDVGGRLLLKRHQREVRTVAMDDLPDGGTGVLRDIDTPEALDSWR